MSGLTKEATKCYQSALSTFPDIPGQGNLETLADFDKHGVTVCFIHI